MLLKLHNNELTVETVAALPAPQSLADIQAGDEITSNALLVPEEAGLSGLTLDFNQFDLILLTFPAYKDGRAFSLARLLRERFGFKGDIRATGDVLRDQLLFMARCGFSSFEVDPSSAADGFQEALGEFAHFYQPAVNSLPVWQLRHQARQSARLTA